MEVLSRETTAAPDAVGGPGLGAWTPSDERAFEASLVHDERYRFLWLIAAGLIVNPAFAVLDRIVYPEHWRLFIGLRLLGVVEMLGAGALAYHTRRYAVLVVSEFVTFVTVAWVISAMGHAAGQDSRYFIGILVAQAFVAALSTLPMWTMFMLNVLMVAGYLVPLLRHPTLDVAPLATNLFYLASGAFVSLLGTKVRQQLARREFASRRDLARSNTLLEAGNGELRRSADRYRLLVETTSAIPWEFDIPEWRFTYVGPQAIEVLGHPLQLWLATETVRTLFPPKDLLAMRETFSSAARTGTAFETECQMLAADGRMLSVRWVGKPALDEPTRLRGLVLDVSQLKTLEVELRQAQKLESVGRLAAGVAHEINTPIQFVGDSIRFVHDGLDDLLALVTKLQTLHQELRGRTPPEPALEALCQALTAANLPELAAEMPQALDDALDGVRRVATIVRSMKEFAHPDTQGMAGADLNRAIQSTLTVARNEYKYVADVETDFAELPPVECQIGELNQAVLNIVVNAAHAIGDAIAGTPRRGLIRVRTWREGGDALIAISDDGSGIPAEIRDRVFDPFFTTKEVGKGTGQGLAVARSIVVDKHGGSLTFDSEVGRGTTFTIRLPLERARAKRGAQQVSAA